MNAMTLVAAENQTHDYYMTIGPMFADPVARVCSQRSLDREQHVTQYESLIDPHETWLEKWLLHEANEAYNYYSCVESETNPRVKAIWERFLDYELGQFAFVRQLFEEQERRDAAEVLPQTLPDPIPFQSQREFVRKTLREEVNLRARGKQLVDKSQEGPESLQYRNHINSGGSPSETVAAGYRWSPGTELNRKIAA